MTPVSVRRPTHWPLIAFAVSMIACGEGSENPEAGTPEPESYTTTADQTVGAAPDDTTAAREFWAALQTLCGMAFEGVVTESEPPDPSFDTARLVMHVRECGETEIRIPFFVGEDRSRTWVITTTSGGLSLAHDHYHEDGTEDAISRYGGDTTEPGTATLQQFPADAFTGDLVPAATNNVWVLELVPGQSFTYALRREGSDRRFRAEFDLRHRIDPPPSPWGS